MSSPTVGTETSLKRTIRYLSVHPRGLLTFPRGQVSEELNIWTDSDWAGDGKTRTSCRGSYIQKNGGTICHWSNTQGNVALLSGEAELNSAVNIMSEGIGVINAAMEMFGERRTASLRVDASACKGMLLRAGTGKVRHLSTKQLWVQGAIQSYGVEVHKVPRADNASDVLTHPVGVSEWGTTLGRRSWLPVSTGGARADGTGDVTGAENVRPARVSAFRWWGQRSSS